MDGHNVFFSGAAGTGKTFLLNAIIDQLRASYENFFDEVAVSAMTGLAASYLNGTTIHSALGLGVAPTWGGYVKNMSRSGCVIRAPLGHFCACGCTPEAPSPS